MEKCEICDKKTDNGRYFKVIGMGKIYECRECASNQIKIKMGII